MHPILRCQVSSLKLNIYIKIWKYSDKKTKKQNYCQGLNFYLFSFYRHRSWSSTYLKDGNNIEYLDAKATTSTHILNRLSLALKKRATIAQVRFSSQHLPIRFCLLRDDFITVHQYFQANYFIFMLSITTRKQSGNGATIFLFRPGQRPRKVNDVTDFLIFYTPPDK